MMIRWGSRRALAGLVVLTVAMVTPSCSGSDDTSPTGDSRTTVTEPSGTAAAGTSAPPTADELAAAFDGSFDSPTSPEPVKIALADGTTAWVVDTGPKNGTPVLFVGGTGTSATVVRLVEFLSSAREKLGIRLISIDRNGFGDQPLDESEGYEDFAKRALGVMDALKIDKFSMVAISGGGPYSAAVAAAAPQRVRSVHLGAAYSGDPIAGTLKQLCGLPAEARAGIAASSAADPVGWWAFPDGAPVLQIPGFVDAAVADAKRTFQVTDTGSNPAGLAHEFSLFCTPTTTDVTKVNAPVFLYYGDEDTTVPGEYADQWKKRYTNVAADRRFPAVAHDVTYRHWGQILLDIASPTKPKVLYCQGGAAHVKNGDGVADGSSLDVCAWDDKS